MEKRWKRLGAGLLATILLVAAVLQWRTHRESVAKVALAAEIRAERAARPAPPEPLPTREEEETATLYREAVSLLTVDEYLSLEFEGVGEAMDSPPWDAVPGSIKEILAANVGALTLADAAEARGVCRFSDSSLQARVSACTMLLRLVSARGHVALAEGDPLAAAKEVRRLLGLGRDLAAASVIVGSEVVFPWPDMHLLRAEAAAAELLAALATAPDLPPEVGPAIAAAARAPWDSAHANRRALEVNEASSDALLLALLSPGAEAWLEERNRQWMEIEAMLRLDPPIHGFLPRAWDRIGRFLSPSPSVPRAEEMRFFRDLRTSIVGALRRRDMVALAPDGPHEEAGPLFGFLGPAWFRLTVAGETRVALARAAAAIRAYQLKEGRPPGTLADLVPALLPELPLDPIDGKPLLYEVAGDGWRLASRVWRESWRGWNGDEEEPGPPEVRFPRRPR